MVAGLGHRAPVAAVCSPISLPGTEKAPLRHRQSSEQVRSFMAAALGVALCAAALALVALSSTLQENNKLAVSLSQIANAGVSVLCPI
eukprot:3567903-Rhodomonas_salina.2